MQNLGTRGLRLRKERLLIISIDFENVERRTPTMYDLERAECGFTFDFDNQAIAMHVGKLCVGNNLCRHVFIQTNPNIITHQHF